MTEMYDATHADLAANAIPADAAMVAGYNDGASWCTWTAEDWARFPDATKVHITVVGNNSDLDADVADCERGDFTPQTAAAWARAKINAGRGRPTIYCSTSSYGAVAQALAAVGLAFGRDVDWWEAHYDNVAQLSGNPGAVAKQYQSTQDYDLSITNGQWPAPPRPVTTTNYFQEDVMQKIVTTLSPGLDANGDGYYHLPEIADVTNIVNIVFRGTDPATSHKYDTLPKAWDVDPAGNNIIIEGGAPGAEYAATIFVAVPT